MPDTRGQESTNMNGYCGCSSTSSNRGFLTKSEKVEMLKEYKEQLDLESKGVAERINELQKAEAEN